jgi:acyl carrier protein phosphodiesterase
MPCWPATTRRWWSAASSATGSRARCLPACLPPDLARGVALHRAIDSHAETHPAFRRSRARVSPARRRYAGVLVDIFYDHLLARDWAALHPQPFADYRHAVYGAVAARVADLPEHSHYALRLMAAEDWFHGYARLDGIADVLARMSRRARRPNPLAGGEARVPCRCRKAFTPTSSSGWRTPVALPPPGARRSRGRLAEASAAQPSGSALLNAGDMPSLAAV